jgi:hypothetical protein
VSEKLKTKNKGHMGMYFTCIGSKGSKKRIISNRCDGSEGELIWYNDDNCMRIAAAAAAADDDESN